MDPSFFPKEGPSSNFISSEAAISPLHEVMMPPRGNATDLLSITQSLPPPIDPCMQVRMSEKQPSTFASFLNPCFPSLNQIPIKPPPSFMTLLQGNEISIRHAELSLDPTDPRHFSPEPSVDMTTAPLFTISSLPLPIYTTESISCPPREVNPPPYLLNLLETSYYGSKNQSSNNQYCKFNSELNSDPTPLNPIGSTAQDTSNEGAALYSPQDSNDLKPMYICSICQVHFRTAQAYGGHMSSHSKVRKTRDRWRPLLPKTTQEIFKKPRLDLNVASVNTEKSKGVELLASNKSGSSLKLSKGIIIRELSDKSGVMTEEPTDQGNIAKQVVAESGERDYFQGFI